MDREGGTRVIHSVTFPGYQSTFITSMVFGGDINVLFAASLDGNLRVYTDKLLLRSCMPWHNGLVRASVYNTRRREVITAGSLGVKVRTAAWLHEGRCPCMHGLADTHVHACA